MTYSFLQKVETPEGPGLFIGRIMDSERCQVALKISATKYNKDELIKLKPSIADMSQIDFINWQKSTHIQVNKIFDLSDVKPFNEKAIA